MSAVVEAEPAISRRHVPWQLSFLVLGAIWGCSFWWIKVGLRAVSFVDVAFLRLAFGAAALLAVSAVTRTGLPRRPATWGHLFVLGMLFCSIPFTLFSYGETHISAVLAGLINALTPLTAIAATIVVFRLQRPSRRTLTGMGLGLGGVVVVLGVWNGIGGGRADGVAACLGAVVCYGVGFPYSARYVTGRSSGRGVESPIALATGQVLSGVIQLLPFALITGRIHPNPPATSFLAMAALGTLGTGIAYVLNFSVIKNSPPAVASTVTYTVPVYAVIVGAVFLGEAVTWNEPIGALLILAGAAVTHDLLRRREQPGRAATTDGSAGSPTASAAGSG